MKKTALALSIAVLLVGCQKKEASVKQPEKCSDTTAKPEGKQFEMYTMSEMAALMEQMYVENQRVKKQIAKGGPIGEFPAYYNNIHTAAFTDETENDAYFKEKAKSFIAVQKKMYADTDLANAKKNYNAGIDACIACHENKCGGPIPKIKKLYLK